MVKGMKITKGAPQAPAKEAADHCSYCNHASTDLDISECYCTECSCAFGRSANEHDYGLDA